jgi:hypothetical protein
LRLEPARAAAVGVHGADDGSRQVPVGIDPFGVGLERDAVDRLLGDARRRGVVELAGQDDPAGVLGELGGESGGPLVQQWGQLGRHLRRLGDEEGIGDDVARRHRQGEGGAIAVVDATP